MKRCATYLILFLSAIGALSCRGGGGKNEQATDTVLVDELRETTVRMTADSVLCVLTDVVPDLILEIRYYSTYNFTGARVDGYLEPVALLTQPAADSLRAVSEEVREMGYRLKVFDAYRPQRAVDAFARWAETDEQSMKDAFFPEIDKAQIPGQYVAFRSSHSRGSTIDLTLVETATGKEVDMGCPFDYFGSASSINTLPGERNGRYTPITEEQYAHRLLLREAMLSHGWRPYDDEWWHFTLSHEPYPNTYFDYPVCLPR